MSAPTYRYDGEVKEYYIKCDCNMHLVQVTHWVDEDDTFLTWWEMGPNTHVPLWDRLRLAWKALKRGYVSDYELCLSKDSRNELVEALNAIDA